jgi:acyl carrier protein
MKPEEIKAKVLDLVNECSNGFDEGEVTETSHFRDDLGFDSLDRVELLMKVEKEYQITIPDEVTDDMQTVGDVVNYIKRVVSE